MLSNRPGSVIDRFESVVGYNLGIVTIFTTHDNNKYHEGQTLVAEDDLFRVEF